MCLCNILRNKLRKWVCIMSNRIIKSSLSTKGFMPKLAYDFASLIEKQAKPVYETMGLIIPVITSSTVVFIFENKTASLLDIARGLEITHQLASQRVKILLKLGIIQAFKDTSDKRKTNYQLTEFGIEQSKVLSSYLDKASLVFSELNEELGCDLMELLFKVNNSFQVNSLQSRIFKERQ